jgi:hypothetical protein
MKKRLFISALVLGTVFLSVFGFAATLGVSAGGIGAGSGSVGSCDSDGVSTTYADAWDTTDKRYEVTTVTVSGIANACDGKTLKAALTDSSDVKLGDGNVVVPTDAAAFTATVSTLTPNPAASAVDKVHVVIGD